MACQELPENRQLLIRFLPPHLTLPATQSNAGFVMAITVVIGGRLGINKMKKATRPTNQKNILKKAIIFTAIVLVLGTALTAFKEWRQEKAKLPEVFVVGTGCQKSFTVICGTGKYKSGSSCLACPAGTYKAVVGDQACTPCPAGQYQPSPGQTSCQSCGTTNPCKTSVVSPNKQVCIHPNENDGTSCEVNGSPGKCLNGNCGFYCFKDADCDIAKNERCNDKSHLCEVGYCREDSECEDDQECKNNKCTGLACVPENDNGCWISEAKGHQCVESKKADEAKCGGTDMWCQDGECVSMKITLKVDLKIDLEVKSDDTSSEVKIKLVQGSETKDEETVSVDSNGERSGIEFEGLLAGSYKIIVKPKGYLSRAKTVSLSETVVDVGFDVFLAGDLNETSYNLINSLDYSIFKNHFKTDDRVTDFNGDGQVNTLDYSIFVRNYNKTGEE